jgi:mRNA-degrading endonuclease RelE of RelBE toxin-antitoxin system
VESEKYRIFVEPSADRRLTAHIEFLAHVSKNAAVQLYKAYEESLWFLENSPKNCPIYIPQALMDAELKYKLFGKRYRIVFEILGNTVYVYDIQDCRQDIDKNLI